MTRGVIEASDRRDRLRKRPDGSRCGRLIALPVADGVLGNEELVGGVGLVPSQQVANLEDLESRGGRVVRPPTFVDLAESCLEDADYSPGDRRQQLGAIKPRFEVLIAAVTAAELTQVRSRCDTQQSSCEENGAVREPFSRGVLQAADAKVDGEGSVAGHIEGYAGRKQSPI
ncbi:MAG TPA: hypothetical protein PLD86_14795 [Vicinamibacteria bacterium]|nr:hypothetical protein [Vicinamibacteria bacterium]